MACQLYQLDLRISLVLANRTLAIIWSILTKSCLNKLAYRLWYGEAEPFNQ
jgi:hypothetical protein